MANFDKNPDIDLYHKAQLLNGVKKILEMYIDKKVEADQVRTIFMMELKKYCIVTKRNWSEDVEFIDSSDDTDDYGDDTQEVY